jgi:hypothetical protein
MQNHMTVPPKPLQVYILMGQAVLKLLGKN